ncbi:MAG: hypothetical protein ACRC17_03085 [Culicoidibacterales bacterium]
MRKNTDLKREAKQLLKKYTSDSEARSNLIRTVSSHQAVKYYLFTLITVNIVVILLGSINTDYWSFSTTWWQYLIRFQWLGLSAITTLIVTGVFAWVHIDVWFRKSLLKTKDDNYEVAGNNEFGSAKFYKLDDFTEDYTKDGEKND